MNALNRYVTAGSRSNRITPSGSGPSKLGPGHGVPSGARGHTNIPAVGNTLPASSVTVTMAAFDGGAHSLGSGWWMTNVVVVPARSAPRRSRVGEKGNVWP